VREFPKKRILVSIAAIFIGLPLLFWAVGDVPRRTVLKESLSLLTLLAFCLMLAQFFLARTSRGLLKDLKMGTVIKIHKVIGYLFVAVLLVHPFFVVLPRYFEAGVAPMEAFVTMLTTFDSVGIVVGIVAWCLLLLLAITSLIRKKLPMEYTTWRLWHGIMALVFISLATWHAIELGRHTDRAMSIYMSILAVSGILFLLKTYVAAGLQRRRMVSHVSTQQ